jgi:hypothetical protein
MAIDAVTAQAHLDQWIAADLAVAGGQSYSIGGRSLTRVNASEIRQQIDYWESKVNRAGRLGGPRVRHGYVRQG